MPTSAYKGESLKKNPLLGTATATVAQRAGERERFMGLYGEAKTMAGQGRTGMQGALASRYARFSENDQAALGDLKSRYSGLQAQANTVRDPAQEKKLGETVISTEAKAKNVPKVLKKKKAFFEGLHMDAVKAQEAYELSVADRVKALNDEGKPLAAEYDRRAHALQQHIDDYNLFLGSY